MASDDGTLYLTAKEAAAELDVSLPTLYAYGLITPTLMGLGLATLLPVVVTIPLGAWLAQRLSPAAFDKVVLVLLSGLALRLIWDALV